MGWTTNKLITTQLELEFGWAKQFDMEVTDRNVVNAKPRGKVLVGLCRGGKINKNEANQQEDIAL